MQVLLLILVAGGSIAFAIANPQLLTQTFIVSMFGAEFELPLLLIFLAVFTLTSVLFWLLSAFDRSASERKLKAHKEQLASFKELLGKGEQEKRLYAALRATERRLLSKLDTLPDQSETFAQLNEDLQEQANLGFAEQTERIEKRLLLLRTELIATMKEHKHLSVPSVGAKAGSKDRIVR